MSDDLTTLQDDDEPERVGHPALDIFAPLRDVKRQFDLHKDYIARKETVESPEIQIDPNSELDLAEMVDAVPEPGPSPGNQPSKSFGRISMSHGGPRRSVNGAANGTKGKTTKNDKHKGHKGLKSDKNEDLEHPSLYKVVIRPHEYDDGFDDFIIDKQRERIIKI